MKKVVIPRMINGEKKAKNPIGIAIGSGYEISDRRGSGIGRSIAAMEDSPVSLAGRKEKRVRFGAPWEGGGGEGGEVGGGGDGEEED